jgi:NAD(P)-dependent dehydrogenase (short-subunit alcohol dehydrogenase family)
MSLKNATVVVLGGSSGIGLATAKAAQAEGARVIIAGRSKERLERAGAELGPTARTVPLDVNDERGTAEFFAGLDVLDHLFTTAGAFIGDAGLLPDTAALRPALDTRFWGALYAAKHAAPRMRRDGSITFMSGIAALRPIQAGAVATASCGAIEAFARALAVDLAPIRVNAIRPGFVDTPLLDAFLGPNKPAVVETMAKRLPVRRVGRPEDIADGVLFLMKNGYVTGISLTIDGGGLLI